MAEAPVRNLAVDFYRVVGVVLIVVGHWLAASVTYRDGSFGRQNPLTDQPWTQWLTWLFQAVPAFFLVAGYAAAVSWGRRRADDDVSRLTWVRRRVARVLGPSSVYIALVSVCVVAFERTGTSGALLQYAGWAVAMHLWFLAVYLIAASLTPIAVAAQRRWGLLAPAALVLGVAAVDGAVLVGHLPYLGWLNYLLCWGLLYQLGIAWQKGSLAGSAAVLLGAGSASALGVLIWLGPYPVSMIGVPGQAVQNTEPPSLAMAAFGCAQAGLLISLAPIVDRVLRPKPIRRLLAGANTNVMALYLWHMLPVVVVAVIAYPAGLLPQPAEGGTAWWLGRLQWVAVLAVVTAFELAGLWWGRGLFAVPLPGVEALGARWAGPLTLIGTLMASYGLASLAAGGFAPDGHFPWTTASIFGGGVVLVALRPRTRHGVHPTPLSH